MSAQALRAGFRLSVGEGASRFSVAADLALDEGVLVLFGPSGAGKTLTLQALGGLLRPDSGNIVVRGETFFDGEAGTFVPPRHRRVGYVPQHHALFPFRTVLGNVVFGLPRARRSREDPDVADVLDELGIADLADQLPGSLSGGERQRVAVARALVARPRLLLLDEPFASIDLAGRVELRTVLLRTLKRYSIPAVFVTHDPDEARAVGDRIALFQRGRTVSSDAAFSRDGVAKDASLGDRPNEGGTKAESAPGEAVTVSGKSDGPFNSAGSGHVELHLREATVTAPADWVTRDDDGTVRVTRPSPPGRRESE